MDERRRRFQRSRLAAAMLLLSGSLSVACQGADSRYPERWIYCGVNLQVDQSATDVIALIDRARKDGYTALVIADYKLQVLNRVTDNYYRNVEKVKAAAAKAGIELIPAVFSIGYSNGHLAHDPNLAEGLPVVDQPFVVRLQTEGAPTKGIAGKKAAGGGARHMEAVVDTRSSARLKNGNLEQVQGDRFVGFGFQDDPGVTTFADHNVVHGGRVSCRFEPAVKGPKRESPNVRLTQRVALRPHTAYRLSFWARTKGLGPVRRLPDAGPGHRPARPAAHFSGRVDRGQPGLEAGRCRLQQPGPEGSQPLCRDLGRGSRHALG